MDQAFRDRCTSDMALSRIADALIIAMQHGMVEGQHHKMWVIDQMVRALLGDDPSDYQKWVDGYLAESQGEDWEEGVPP